MIVHATNICNITSVILIPEPAIVLYTIFYFVSKKILPLNIDQTSPEQNVAMDSKSPWNAGLWAQPHDAGKLFGMGEVPFRSMAGRTICVKR